MDPRQKLQSPSWRAKFAQCLATNILLEPVYVHVTVKMVAFVLEHSALDPVTFDDDLPA